ncbi:hypothetical protein H206_02620 [Candidatus Electrothrix aarhusensis]|jgi:hypothetical protein|uniref:Uncharacterized protein n=1 Tax=Candidatus Electrothrix aarhusensis TaxID=1859131 RepID=A0A3S3QG54_9BACT|nr:hypothetical protein H206_02620 [Candidatus Electrothrix aarhusensis]
MICSDRVFYQLLIFLLKIPFGEKVLRRGWDYTIKNKKYQREQRDENMSKVQTENRF